MKTFATQGDIVKTIGVAILMSGGPSIVYSQKANDAMEEFLK